jgi:hypothetical protein
VSAENEWRKISEDFEKGVGTYLKVVKFHEPSNPDGFIVLYLRPSGRFLLLGSWQGYERSAVAGRWSKDQAVIRLEGNGATSIDSVGSERAGRFERELHLQTQNHTPVLVAPTELSEWSLLGWRGPFTYAGLNTIINGDGWLPRSDADIENWISRIVDH